MEAAAAAVGEDVAFLKVMLVSQITAGLGDGALPRQREKQS